MVHPTKKLVEFAKLVKQIGKTGKIIAGYSPSPSRFSLALAI
jgi:hypothetical protein